MSQELRECPFCGSKDKYISNHKEDCYLRLLITTWTLKAKKQPYCFDEPLLRKLWDSRPLEDALLEENKRLKEIVNSFTSGFSLNIFGVLPNGNEACGRDEGMVRGCEFLSELYDKSLPFIEKNSPSAQEALK